MGKRMISAFEKCLIEKGWKLDYKRYIGKHSERVLSYVYTKEFGDVNAFCEVRASDRTLLEIGYDNNGVNYISYYTLDVLKTKLQEIHSEVRAIQYKVSFNLSLQSDDPDEVVEVVESFECDSSK